MKRLTLVLYTLFAFAPLVGCGTDGPPPADKSNMPPEVKAEEDKLEADTARREAEIQKRSKKGH